MSEADDYLQVHLTHCYQGENQGVCAYMDEGCPAKPRGEAGEGSCPSAKATAIAAQIIDYLQDDARLETVAGDVIAIARIIESSSPPDPTRERPCFDILPAPKMTDRELLELALESHVRAVVCPDSGIQRDRADGYKNELLRRLGLRSEKEIVAALKRIKKHRDARAA